MFQPAILGPPYHILTTSHSATMRFHKPTTALFALAITMLFGHTHAGPVAYGVCRAGCVAVQAACYVAAGSTFGTVFAAATPPAVAACDGAYGACYASCWSALVRPSP